MAPVKKTIKKPAGKEKAVKKEPVINPEKNRETGLDAVVFNQEGKEVSNISLPLEIFGLKVNSDLISQAVTAQMANSRDSIAHAKDRSEVRGGGKKPWKQKGTGRARHASIRSPLWAGGGVTFGPRTEKNFSVKINKKMKRQALFMVLSGKLRDGELIILDDLKLKQAKTKDMAQAMEKIGAGVKMDLAKGTMIVLSKKDEMVFRAAKNLPKILTMGVNSLNVVDLLSSRYLLMPKEAVEKIRETFGKTS